MQQALQWKQNQAENVELHDTTSTELELNLSTV